MHACVVRICCGLGGLLHGAAHGHPQLVVAVVHAPHAERAGVAEAVAVAGGADHKLLGEADEGVDRALGLRGVCYVI